MKTTFGSTPQFGAVSHNRFNAAPKFGNQMQAPAAAPAAPAQPMLKFQGKPAKDTVTFKGGCC